MDLEGKPCAVLTEESPLQENLMLQCTAPSQPAFPSLQMDLQQSSLDASVKCEDSRDGGGCVSSIIDNSCSSSDSLLQSPRSSPVSPPQEDDDNLENVTDQTQVVQHWSYEEQFRQLYNMSSEPDRKEFLDKLFSYMQKKGTPITRIPIMAKQPLDMYKLFKLVVERGGLVEVIKKKAWRDIAKELNLPASITSAAFTMRSQYVKYLYPFECEEKKLSDPKELQVAIESNKRDRRHSDNVEFLPTTRENDRRDTLTTGQQPPFTVAGGPSGLQLITSPTVAIPQTSLPPYSGGFIITPTPGGAHMVHAPRIAPGGPQLVQMAAAHPQVPIIVPTSLTGTPPSFTTMVPVKPDLLCPPTSLVSREKKMDDHVVAPDASPQIWKNSIPGLISVSNKPNESLVPTVVLDRKHEDIQPDSEEDVPQAKRMATESNSSSLTSISTVNSAGIPFTNISIKPAISGINSTESSPSVLVTLELNNTVYQGVLFARPRTSHSPSR